ncbi:MAG: alpha/beta hydrolase [Alphaproteobacteria bacterium]|nr:alpha/beta hydrolase [Alphaproteobacteria bacterium]
MPLVSLPDGLRLMVEDDGGDKPPLLLLNGSSFNLGQWNTLVKKGGWRQRYRLIRFDYADTGGSERRDRPVSVEVLAEETVALLDAMGLEAVHTYGVSQGTIVAQGVAVLAPERLLSVCGYGWYHGGYSRLDETAARIGQRLVPLRRLEPLWEQPLDRAAFDALWGELYREALLGQRWEELNLLERLKDWALRRWLFPLLAPTPIGRMYDWFHYCVQDLLPAQPWLERGHAALADKPVLLQHAEADQTLDFGMAEELHAALPGSRLIAYGEGYNHVSPNFKAAHARQVVADHVDFLATCAS